MKNLTIALSLAFSLTSFAHMIEGTRVLKGSLKTKIEVDGVKSECKVKISKIKNLMQEDSFGNPAYQVKTELSLEGKDMEKFNQEIWLNNLFVTGDKSEVRDLEYSSKEGSSMKIDRSGRIKAVSFLYKAKTITCSF